MKSAIRSTAGKIRVLFVAWNTFRVDRNPLLGLFDCLTSTNKADSDSVRVPLQGVERQRAETCQSCFRVNVLPPTREAQLWLREVSTRDFRWLWSKRLITHLDRPHSPRSRFRIPVRIPCLPFEIVEARRT